MAYRFSAGRERIARRGAAIRARARARRESASPVPSPDSRPPLVQPFPHVEPVPLVQPLPHVEPVPHAEPAPHVEPVPHIAPALPPSVAPVPGAAPRRDATPRREREPSKRTESNPADNDGAQGEQTEEASQVLDRYGALQLPAPGKGNSIHCLTIIGQIEGHLTLPPQNKTTKYEHTIPQLVAIELNPAIEGLLVILNTVGGDVEAGLAIAEMVASLSKPKVSLVVGGGHSIGVPIAVAADRSFITHTATMTIHPIRLSGLVVGVPQTYEYLDKMQDRVVKFIVSNSHISEGCFRELMFRTGELARDIGTVLVGHDAVRVGLVDAVGGLDEAITELKGLIEERRRGKPLARHGNAARPAGRDAGDSSTNDRGDEGLPPVYHSARKQPSEALECPWRPEDS